MGKIASVSFVFRWVFVDFGVRRFTSPGLFREPRRWVEGACEGNVVPVPVRVGHASGLDVLAPTIPVKEVGTSGFGGGGVPPLFGLPLRKRPQYTLKNKINLPVAYIGSP